MSKVFLRKQFSNYLGENRALDDIIVRFEADISPSPTPTPVPVTPTPTPTPSITPSITPTNTPTPTTTKTPTPTPTRTSTPTPTRTPAPACDITYTELPSPTPSPTPTITPTNTSSPTPTPTASPGPSFDPDAQAFITATGISGGDATAINTLVVSLKLAGVWTLIDAAYPFIGGTPTSVKYNLKDPRDLDIAYRMAFNGSWIINNSGVKPTTADNANYGDTFWSPSTRNDEHHYYRYINEPQGGYCEYAGNGPGPYFMMGACNQLEWFDGGASTGGGGSVIGTAGFSQGISRTNANSVDFYKKETGGSWVLYSNNTSPVGTLLSNSMYIGTINSANFPGESRYAFLSYGQDLTPTQINNLDTIVTTFNTTLGRNF